MKQEISELVKKINATIRDFSEGSITLEEARSRYAALEKTCHALETGLARDNASGFLEGICYHHNANNFTVTSGIFCLDRSGARTLCYHGTEKLSLKIAGFLQGRFGERTAIDIEHVPPSGENGLMHTAHLKRLYQGAGEAIIFAALSSSARFSDDLFIWTGDIITQIIFGGSIFPYRINYYDAVARDIFDYVRLNSDSNHQMIAHLFTFPGLESTFIHMGVRTLFDGSRDICRQIAAFFEHASPCFRLSLKEYVIITKAKRNESIPRQWKKTSIFFKGVAVPHRHIEFVLGDEQSLRRFWWEAFRSEGAETGEGKEPTA